MSKKTLVASGRLYGRLLRVYGVPATHPKLRLGKRSYALGVAYVDDFDVYVSDTLSEEAFRNVVAHELQHIIEEFYGVNHERQCGSPDASDERTNLLSLGWRHLICESPELVAFLSKHRR